MFGIYGNGNDDEPNRQVTKKDRKKKKKAKISEGADTDNTITMESPSIEDPTTENGALNPEESIADETTDTGDGGKKRKKKSRINTNYTVSVALPGSILSNAQNALLKSYLVGQIARALAVFNIDEVIVFDDYNGQYEEDCVQMARILQYLECPQYLRKFVFPVHSDLQYAGVMNPLDIPHHLRKDEMLPYREGIVINKPVREGERGCFVHIGLEKDVHVNTKLQEGLRVTIKLDEATISGSKKKKMTGVLVDPTVPKTEDNLYWGYNVRLADSFNSVFTKCPYDETGGYDVTIGTSDKGTSIEDESFTLKESFQHLLIVFGGLHGLEFALENDDTLTGDDVSKYFNHYLNTCPSQGSRTIRTEEAVLITMARLKPIIAASQLRRRKRKKDS